RQELAAQNSEMLRVNQPREVPIDLEVNDLRKALGLPPLADADSAQPQFVQIRGRIYPAEIAIVTDEASRIVSRPPTLAAFSVTETLLVWLKVSMACGVVLASPYIFWELWSFVAAGLYPHERRQVYAYLPGSIILFLVGVVFCELIVLPAAVSYLLAFND